MDFLSARRLLKKRPKTYVSVCKSVSISSTPLWRVIKRGSGVRWMCNCIAHSFSFFPSSPSHHLCFFSLFLSFCKLLVLSGLSSQLGELAFTYRPVRGVPTFMCVILTEGCAAYANYMCVHQISHTHTHRLSWQHLLSAPWTPDSSLFLFFWLTALFKSLQPRCNGKRHCSCTYWLLDPDLMACKFCFVGE